MQDNAWHVQDNRLVYAGQPPGRRCNNRLRMLLLSEEVPVIEIAEQEGFREGAAADTGAGFIDGIPVPAVDFCIRSGICIRKDDCEVQHQRVGRDKEMGTVETDRECVHAEFLTDFADSCILGILTLIHVTRDKDAFAAAVLPDEQDSVTGFVGADHADGCVENRKAEFPAGRTERDPPAFACKIFICQDAAALHAAFHQNGLCHKNLLRRCETDPASSGKEPGLLWCAGWRR